MASFLLPSDSRAGEAAFDDALHHFAEPTGSMRQATLGVQAA
jgi:hypothetical protein